MNFTDNNLSSVSGNNFASSFSTQISSISFSWLTAQARTFSNMLNRNGESRHSCVISDLRGKLLIFNQRACYQLWGFHRWLIYCRGQLPLFLVCWIFLTMKDDAFCHFLHQLRWTCGFFPFILLPWCITMIDFHMLNSYCITGIKQNWS